MPRFLDLFLHSSNTFSFPAYTYVNLNTHFHLTNFYLFQGDHKILLHFLPHDSSNKTLSSLRSFDI